MTKAIKDIGREVWAYEKWRTDNNFDCTATQKWGSPDKVVIMSPEERRELMWRVWQACDKSNETDYRGDLINDISSEDAFKQFIEREKL